MAWGEYLRVYALGEQMSGHGSPLQSSLLVPKKWTKWEPPFVL